MELLSEADFTSAKLRMNVLKIVGSDLLFNKSITDAELKACSRIGPRVLEALIDTISLSGPRVEATNFFRLALSMGTAETLQMVHSNPEFLARLGVRDLVVVLRRLLPVISGPRWFEYIRLAIAKLEKQLLDSNNSALLSWQELGPSIESIARDVGSQLRRAESKEIKPIG
jgi:hypothetical protein